MKRVVLKILAFFGFKRKKPKTKLGRFLRRCEHALTVASVLYLLVLVFPQPCFSHSFEHMGIQVHSTQPIPETEMKPLLSQVRTRIRTSQIYQEQQTFRIFLCNNNALYTFLSPLSRYSFANTQPSGNIFLANVDLVSDTVTPRNAKYRRTFVGVASHEICHVMIRRAFGLWTAYSSPKWLNEGYCDHIARESTFPEEEGDDLLSQGKEAEISSFKYFVYRRMVEFCLTEQDRNIIELFSDTPSEKDIRDRTQKWVSRTSNKSMQVTPNGAPDD